MKVLFIGLGGVGQRHLRNLRALLGAEVELIAYRTRRLSDVITPSLGIDRTKNLEQEYNIRAFESLESALAASPDIAFICNPSSLHMDAALSCAEAGCDLFIEKPVSSDLKNVERLVELVDSRSLVAMVGYQLRFHPCLERLRSVLKDGGIGQVLTARACVGEYLPFWHRYEDYRQMYASRADLGGGVVLSQIHEMDYLYSLFGTPRRVFALGGHWSDLEINVEDVASIMMEFTSRGRPLPVHLQLDYLQYPPARQCEIVGENGRVVMDLVANEVVLYANGNTSAERFKFDDFERNNLFLDELSHFLSCVEKREQPIVTLEDGVQSLRMALAAKESMGTGRVVELEQVAQTATIR